MHPHEAALALIGLFQEGESVADFQEGDFLREVLIPLLT